MCSGDGREDGLCYAHAKMRRGILEPLRTLSGFQIADIRRRRRLGETVTALAHELGLPVNTVRGIRVTDNL
jgi:hypothetical protein